MTSTFSRFFTVLFAILISFSFLGCAPQEELEDTEVSGGDIGIREPEPESDLQFPFQIYDADEENLHDVVVSYNDGTLSEVEQRRREQEATRHEFSVFHEFSFSYEREKTGIDFRHRIVNDAGIDFNFNHYDHGNGLAVADVNGDGFYDVYFVTQIGPNELWKNNGDGTFTNITEEAGVAMMKKVSISASFADIDNDGDADLYVTTVKHGNTMFENDGTGKFQNISKHSGLDYKGHSSGAVFLDYNLDGLLDLYLVNVGAYTKDEIGENGYYIGNPAAFQHIIIDSYAEEGVLYKNTGNNVFEDVTTELGLDQNNTWSGDAVVVDLNEDRYPDLYILNMEGPDHYYVNQEGKKFIDKTEEYFARTSSGAMGAKFFDADNDLDMDLYVTDMHSDMGFEAMMTSIDLEKKKSSDVTNWVSSHGPLIYGNSFFLQNGPLTFDEVSEEMNLENYWPWGVTVADLNADGYEDIFVTASMNYLYKYVPNLLYLNNLGNEFLNSEYLVNIEPRPENQIEKKWFDLDCVRQHKDHLECKDRSGNITVDRGDEVTVMGSLGSRSSVIFDFDGDGDLDIITNEFNDEPLVLVSNLTEQKEVNYIEVLLEGVDSNRDGLGATVTVYSGENTYRKYHDGASGYLSHSRMTLYFGLGQADSVDKIEVSWPSGKQTIIDSIDSINQVVDIKE